MRFREISSLLLMIALCGCGETASLGVEFAEGQYSLPAQVDTRCENGGCDASPQIEVVVSITNDDLPDAAADIHQYRVDYDLPGADSASLAVPFFANTAELAVAVEAPGTLVVDVAGARQRQSVAEQIGFAQVQGTATLTLAGYDQDDNLVTVEAPFDIIFGDIVDTTGEEGAP